MIKNPTTRFSYYVEPKPDGGFIARPSDPAMQIIEGTTTEEVQEKIQAKLKEAIGEQFHAAFKIGGINLTVNSKMNITTTRADSGRAPSGTQEALGSDSSFSGDLPVSPPDTLGMALKIFVALLGIGVIFFYLLLHR